MAPAGWYDDPSHVGIIRWWDGTNWTDYVATGTHTKARAKRQRIKRHIFLTHARSLVLFGLTIVAAIIGWRLYPPHTPAHVTSNISEIDIYLAAPASPAETTNTPQVTVQMKSDGHKTSNHNPGTMLQFWSGAGSPSIARVYVWVPKSTWGPRATDCGSNQPTGDSCTSDTGGNLKYLSDTNPSPGDWVDIPATAGVGGWGTLANPEYVSIIVPTVTVLQEQEDSSSPDAEANAVRATAIAFMDYRVKLKDDYTWNSGNEPQDITSGDPVFPIHTEASWNPVAENATSQYALEQAQNQTFLAGAVVGVGAAALASAIAELIGISAAESRTRRRLDANTPAMERPPGESP